MVSHTFWGLFWLHTLYRGFCVVSEGTLVATVYVSGIGDIFAEALIFVCATSQVRLTILCSNDP